MVDLRRQLRGPGCGPRTGRKRRPRPGPRPLRDRRAPDVRLRGAHRVAREPGAEGRDTPDLPRALVVHARPPRQLLPPSKLPWTFSTFDYRTLCGLLWDQCNTEFETAKIEGRRLGPEQGPPGPRPTMGELAAPAPWWTPSAGSASWRATPINRPTRRSRATRRGTTPRGPPTSWRSSIDRDYVPAGYGWSFPADDEVRVGVGSFDPRHHVKETTVQLAADLGREPVRYQGNWIPHKLRDATEGEVFFVGDSAGHCLPLTAEGIRTALYFGIACGRELRRGESRAGRRRRRRFFAFSPSLRAKRGSCALSSSTQRRSLASLHGCSPPRCGGRCRAMRSCAGRSRTTSGSPTPRSRCRPRPSRLPSRPSRPLPEPGCS